MKINFHLRLNLNESLGLSLDSFGLLRLNKYSFDPFKSRILSGNQPTELTKFSLREKWTLLYRGTRDGFGAANFHSKCDNYNNTLTIVKAHGTSYIFGGFTSINWGSLFQFKSLHSITVEQIKFFLNVANRLSNRHTFICNYRAASLLI